MNETKSSAREALDAAQAEFSTPLAKAWIAWTRAVGDDCTSWGAWQEATRQAATAGLPAVPQINREAITANLVRLAGLNKHVARDIVAIALGEEPELKEMPIGGAAVPQGDDKAQTDKFLFDRIDVLNAEIAHLRAEALPAGWQPISTAPKDGTEIWLGNKHNVRIGFWSGRRWVDRARAEYSGPNDLLFEPTAWLNLPEPPTAPTEPAK